MAVDPWEWLTLVDSEGPFLSRAALKSFYPSGLPRNLAADDLNVVFADEYVRWLASWQTSDAADFVAARDRWIEVVLRQLLDWSDDLNLGPADTSVDSPSGAVSVAAWGALDGESTPAALVTVVDRTEDLRAVGTDGWSASAIDRMAVLLRDTGVTIGIVTDGRWWGLVSATKDVTTASGIWDALLWREERPYRDAFLALASFTSIAGGQSEKRLYRLFTESVASAEQITEALGDQVRRAVELVLQSMSDTHLRSLSQGEVSPLPADARVVYDGAVTVLMRIVFLLFAEERGLLPEGEIYRSSYAIAEIRHELQREATAAGDEALDHSWRVWHRLLAASNAVYGGASFEDMRMPAYGGSLFDPARFPWLQTTDSQGRLQVRLTDRAMLAVLRAVQTIEDGAMQLSFRDLDVEQIGYVYEGLLGYSAEYATEVMVGLQSGKPGFEPEVPLRELEDIADATESAASFAKRLVEHLKSTQEHSRPRTPNQIAKAYGADEPDAAADARTRLRHTLLGDDVLAGRLQPFHGLIRDDLRGFPYVVPAHGLVMVESPQRANTGTHYTPRSLAEEVVLHALEPLVFSPGPLDTENRDEWKLKSSAEILDLKVADIAAGSGAFLVAAARYLADRLIEARANEGLDVSHESDLKRWAVREVVARCLYGADINGMAVEMCKLSLWLISMDPGKPFSFVDDRVFHGNSLLGVTTEEQLKAQHIYPERRRGREQLLWFDVDRDLKDAARIRRELASGQVDDADRMRSTKAKQALLAQSARVTAKLRDVADSIIAAALLEGGKPGKNLDDRYDDLADVLRAAYPTDGAAPERTELEATIDAGLTPTVDTGETRWKPLHWILEAPDVIHAHGGFDAIVGNPPFLGGKKLSGAMGTNFREWLANTLAESAPGNADLVAFFFLRVAQLMKKSGFLALVATNTVAQGDTREAGLDVLARNGLNIVRAVQSRPWPSTSASLEYAAVWATFAPRLPSWVFVCDDRVVRRISTLLEETGRVDGLPIALRANSRKSFQGCILLGAGFVLNETERAELLRLDPRSAQVIRELANGDDLNSRPDASPSRFAIDFFGLSMAEARDYPAAFARVEELVVPERMASKRAIYREKWWLFAENQTALRAALARSEEALAITRVSKSVMPLLLPSNVLFSNSIVVFTEGGEAMLALLSSSVHQMWAIKYSSTLETRVSYSPSDAFETFPQPNLGPELRKIGATLNSRRTEIMLRRQLGLTDLYNLVNAPSTAGDDDVNFIRSLHAQVDEAVLAAYGWSDIKPDHGFHTYRKMERWTVSPTARVEILDRLLEENHRRAKREAEAVPTKKSKQDKSFEESAAPEGAMF